MSQRLRIKSAQVIEDTVEFEDPQIPGKWWTSKHDYYKSLKARGLAIVAGEKARVWGNADPMGIEGPERDHLIKEKERAAKWGMAPESRLKQQIREVMRQIEWGMAPITELEKHICSVEKRQVQNR